MTKHFLTLTTLLLISLAGSSLQAFGQVPAITSFFPTSDSIGASVTIHGTNFNTTASNNIVFFGGVMATVSFANSDSISVTVPTGSTYAPITVTDITTGLTAYSSAPFIVTFSGDHVIDAASFKEKVNLPAPGNSGRLAIFDLDGDGKLDIIAVSDYNNKIMVFRNTTTAGSITTWSVDTAVDFPTGTTPYGVAIGDVDGDGKPDIAVINTHSSSWTVSVYRNTSTSGSITTGSFAPKVDFPTGVAPFGVVIGDVDGDGKPDIVVNNYGSHGTISVYRNTSTIGSITTGSFADTVNFPAEYGVNGLAIGDMDGDGKPDIVVTTIDVSNKVSVYHNTSTIGSISFEPKVDLHQGGTPYYVQVGDLDGDHKPDLIVTDPTIDRVMVYRNISDIGSITFEDKLDFPTGTYPQGLAIGDLNGDGKPDLAVDNNVDGTVSVFRNTSDSGSISFSDRVNFQSGTVPFVPVIGDLNGDGKPDIVVSNQTGNDLSVFISPQNYVQFDTTGTPPSAVSMTTYLTTDSSGQWEIVPSAVDTVAQIVTADSVTHFSKWAIGIPKPRSLFSKTIDAAVTAPIIRRVYSIVAQGGSGFHARLVLKYDPSEIPLGTPEDSLVLIRLIVNASSVNVVKKWNMISLPVVVANGFKDSLFQQATSLAFSFTPSGYATQDTLRNGVGYWLKFPSVQTISLVGEELTQDSINVAQGWNMIGSISTPVPIGNIGSIPSGIITSNFFTYTGSSYAIADSIQPGVGYWIKVNTSGALILSSAGQVPSSQQIHILPGNEMPPPAPDGSGVVQNIPQNIPKEFSLSQNYPNPFNPTTLIRFGLPQTERVMLSVFNVLGQQVAELVNEKQEAGYHEAVFDGAGLPSGIYFYRLHAGDPSTSSGRSFVETKKLLLMK